MRQSAGRVYRVVDTVILIVCLPFHAVATPLMLLGRWLWQRRRLQLGLGVSHYPCCDVRQEYEVADLSRLSDGLVGIRYRTWGRGTVGTPPWSDSLEFVTRADFWNPTLDRIMGLALA